MKQLVFILLISIIPNLLHAQKEANIWYFGEKAGLDFSAGNPVPLIDGQMATEEGCSTISSPEGELLLYTDGSTVWNKDHNIMPNGTGLLGHPSGTQSGMIVPFPGVLDKVIVFTVDWNVDGGDNGLRYSMVDLNLEGGLGDVVASEKNVVVLIPVAERVTAIKHSNEIDTWVVVNKYGTNEFHSFLVTQSGVSSTAVVSMAGDLVNDVNSQGYMKISPDGTWLARANGSDMSIELFTFDATTGLVGFVAKDSGFGVSRRMYGVEFSPNSTRLYVSTWKSNPMGLYQYNLDAGSPQEIIDSRTLISHSPNGALQLAPNNKIYCIRNETIGMGSLSVINQPNELGTACDFVVNGVYLGGRESNWGLPPFNQSYFNLEIDFSFDQTCLGDETQFTLISSSIPDSVQWNFGDPASGAANTSKLTNPTHVFTTSGTFTVTVTTWVAAESKSLAYDVSITDVPLVDLGADTSFCTGNPFLLDAGAGYDNYLWSNGETSQTIEVTAAGLYWVLVENGPGCADQDTIVLSAAPGYSLETDTSICQGESIFLGGDFQTESGTYYDSLTTVLGCDSILITNLEVLGLLTANVDASICSGDSVFLEGAYRKEPGIYYDTIPNLNSCDSLIVTTLEVSDFLSEERETAICQGDSIWLGGAYQTGEGIYFDTLQNEFSCDSLYITTLLVNPLPLVHLGNDTSILEGDVLLLDATFPDAQYLWQDGFTGAIYNASDSGWYWVEVSTPCGMATDSVFIDYLLDLECFVKVPNAFTPNGDGKNDLFKPVINCDAISYEFMIFDRWGQLVFSSDNQEEGWDGGIAETTFPTGVYLWQLAYKIQINIGKFIEGTENGTLTLLR
ncbi:MAG: gliding motility-associated C-terminal domain-containing protein [Bacteroidales bacterium]|nr:gliding motility-associated C-terminal domain-containing protein [Bacteroidales bacterium]